MSRINKLGRSAYGLDTPAYRETDWRVRGACAQGDWPADWWTNSDTDWRSRRWAMWICRNECPVLTLCRQWAEQHPTLVGQAVYGGVWWTRSQTDTGRRHGPVRPSQFATPEPPPGRGTLCGTQAAVSRHRRRDEPLDEACLAFDARRLQQRRAVPRPCNNERCDEPAASVPCPEPVGEVA